MLFGGILESDHKIHRLRKDPKNPGYPKEDLAHIIPPYETLLSLHPRTRAGNLLMVHVLNITAWFACGWVLAIMYFFSIFHPVHQQSRGNRPVSLSLLKTTLSGRGESTEEHRKLLRAFAEALYMEYNRKKGLGNDFD